MNCIFDISLSTLDIVTLVVAFASAFFAYRSSLAAKKANQIGLLNGRKEIYIAFFYLKMHMLQMRQSAQLVEVKKFYNHSIVARLFFKSDLAQDIIHYYDACFAIADINEGKMQKIDKKVQEHLQTEKILSDKIDQAILSVFKDMH